MPSSSSRWRLRETVRTFTPVASPTALSLSRGSRTRALRICFSCSSRGRDMGRTIQHPALNIQPPRCEGASHQRAPREVENLAYFGLADAEFDVPDGAAKALLKLPQHVRAHGTVQFIEHRGLEHPHIEHSFRQPARGRVLCDEIAHHAP